MFGKFVYGQYSLSEAFWKFCVLGLITTGFLAQLFLRLLKQSVNYDSNFINVAVSSMSLISSNPTRLAVFACYVASFVVLFVYSIICLIGMWNTYKKYDKSKTLAVICMMVVWVMIYFAVKFAIY